MKDAALKLALEALIGARAFLESDAPVEIWGVNDKAITAIKAAMAQDEPVAKYSDIVSDGGLDPRNKFDAPPQRTWVGLTDDEIAKEVEVELTHYWNGEYIDTTGARDQLTAFARAIGAKLKEKNYDK